MKLREVVELYREADSIVDKVGGEYWLNRLGDLREKLRNGYFKEDISKTDELMKLKHVLAKKQHISTIRKGSQLKHGDIIANGEIVLEKVGETSKTCQYKVLDRYNQTKLIRKRKTTDVGLIK